MDDNTAKIIDFGVVHLAGAHSETGQKGTWQYMSPEQIDMKLATPVSDIFSLGVVCYEALTGRKPFARKALAETADAVLGHIPPSITEIHPVCLPVSRHGCAQGNGQTALAQIFERARFRRYVAKGILEPTNIPARFG
jgi:serine/threonine protein kinase